MLYHIVYCILYYDTARAQAVVRETALATLARFGAWNATELWQDYTYIYIYIYIYVCVCTYIYIYI